MFQVGIGIGVVLLLLIVLIWLNSGSDQRPAGPRGDETEARTETPSESPPPSSAEQPAQTPGATPAPQPAGESRFEIVPDDGKQPWQSPTAGRAVSLRYLPPGAQVFVIARPADLLAGPEGPRTLQALGPAFAGTRSAWEAAAGLPLSEIQQLIVSFHDHGEAFPRATLVVRPKTPVTKETLLQKLGGATTAGDASEVFTASNGWSYFLPADEKGGVLVIGKPEEIKEISDARGAPPVIPVALEKLLRTSDDQRHVTVLFSPNELVTNFFRDGRPWSICEPRQVREPLDWFLGNAQAAMFSVHVADATYVELMLVGRLRAASGSPVEAMRDRLQQMPVLVERYVASLNPPPYSRMVALRYPQMVRYLCSQSRMGAEGDLSVINAALPAAAAHNLVFGTEMAVTAPAGAGPIAAPVPPPAGPRTIAELLDAPLSLAFAADSLEFAMQNVENAVKDRSPNLPFPFAVKVLGSDLEKNGITRNQQIRDFNEQNKSVAEILTAMVLKANPIRTVKQPHEKDQQLIWVIGPDPNDPSRNVILITTRDAAAAKSYSLPPVFQLK